MRLKKLELFGFKSFADRTEVHFHKGVTCVVGPNGCGKSNISDSIRWVLGERSAKMLRGTKMEDVIFAGTDFRKPLSFAEVSLTIENSDRGLPIDYNEVTITRRLHRTGESEYLINKTPCRLKDVQDLILDTGIGSNSYSMIEQGRIDHILNADADERRFLIEEAAGISKYKVKKEEAIRKLERTEHNLLRIRDIVAEVQRNIQYAERQARRAQRYREQFEKLKSLEIRKAFYEIGAIKAELDRIGKIRAEQQTEIEALQKEVLEVRSRLEVLSGELRAILERFSREEGRRYELKARAEQHEQQLRFNQEKRVEFAVRRGEIQQEKVQLHERLTKTRLDIESKTGEMEGLESQRLSFEESFELSRQSLHEIEQHLEAAQGLFEETKAQALEAAASAQRVRNDYNKVSAFLESSLEQKRKQEAGVTRYRQELDQWQARKSDCEQSLRLLEQKMQELMERKGREEQRAADLSQESAAAADALEALERLIHEKTTRRNLLQEIDRAAGQSQEVVLQGLSEEEKTWVHRLKDFLHVEPGYEAAVQAVLGEFAQALVTEESHLAARIVDVMTSLNSAPAGILVRQAGPEAAQIPAETLIPPGTRALSGAVRIREGYEALLAPFFQDVYVLEQARALPELLAEARQYRLVTREGMILGPAGRIVYRQGQAVAEQNFFKRDNEIEDLAAELVTLDRERDEAAIRVAGLRELIAQAETSLKALESEFVESKIQKESFESLRKGMQERLGTFQRELDLVFYEQNELQTRESEAISQRTLLEIEIMRSEEKQRRIRAEQEALLADMERMEKSKNDAFREFSERKARLDHLMERRRFLEEALKLHREHERTDAARIEYLDGETARIQERELRLSEEDASVQTQLAATQEEARDCEVKLEFIRQERQMMEETLRQQEEILAARQDRQRELEESLHAEEMKVLDLGYQEKNILDRLLQAYKLDLSAFQPADYPLTEEDRPQVEAEVATLREKIESIGTVNLLAIEEYDELKQRYDFLLGQQKDLEDARDQLMEAIRKINRTTKGLFEATLHQVQTNFKEYYTTLFRGGEAQIVLIDESNPLESGVDIVVRPPGKKLQHISLLSGGEKALTALALMFSLFKIKPSPFCVMDEVDAPLDEANIDRFLTVLRTFLGLSQFIIVTHNRKTIAMGDSLYGVTMQEAGCSKIVSVRVNATDEAFEDKAVEAELESETAEQIAERAVEQAADQSPVTEEPQSS